MKKERKYRKFVLRPEYKAIVEGSVTTTVKSCRVRNGEEGYLEISIFIEGCIGLSTLNGIRDAFGFSFILLPTSHKKIELFHAYVSPEDFHKIAHF